MALAKGRERISSSVFKGLKKEVKVFSEKRHVSMSKYIERAVKEKVDRDRKVFKMD